MEKSYLIFASSSTQRLVASKNEDGSWLLSKEWRKSADEEWKCGKGILLPVISGISTATLLGNVLIGKQETERVWEDVKRDSYTHKNYQNAHYRGAAFVG